ncbi:uncharacterized protein N7482_003288 [Penicillium canariense]|uniref:Myb-like DNA-binding domain-containing protein n=1 Tax=Penicillium canariense TaxID=189055 RepID=A0A9W9LN93_9EURO|nr:uncharacterized protein N7482_003288 [Penicillium canariense]KAJ5167694.1 hypothetical protein N7482_003288 [Penicillium canariense]
MGQRSKVLDTDGPTPKFLHAIIKQLDLKTIDWNRVASELEISNGHAARMRYSRFKTQMDGPSPRAIKKRNAKKAGKDPLKGNIQASPQFSQSGIAPYLEPTESPFQSNPFIKHESGSQGSATPGTADRLGHDYARIRPPNHMQSITKVSQGAWPQYHSSGMSFSLASGMPSSLPLIPSPFASYSSFPISHEVDMQDFSAQAASFNYPPMITWGPATQQQTESAPSPMEIKEEPEAYESKSKDVVVKVEEIPDGKSWMS